MHLPSAAVATISVSARRREQRLEKPCLIEGAAGALLVSKRSSCCSSNAVLLAVSSAAMHADRREQARQGDNTGADQPHHIEPLDAGRSLGAMTSISTSQPG